MAWPGYKAALASDPEGVARVLADSPFFLPGDLEWAIELESGWNPAAVNPKSKAAGLIQMMPATQTSLGVVNVEKASREGQAALIRQFFIKAGAHNAVTRRGDALLAIFAPAGLGKADSFVLFPVGSAGWKQNPAYRPPDDGDITAGSVRAKGTPGAKPPGKGPPLAKLPPKGAKPRASGAGWLLVALAAMAFSGRRGRLTRSSAYPVKRRLHAARALHAAKILHVTASSLDALCCPWKAPRRPLGARRYPRAFSSRKPRNRDL